MTTYFPEGEVGEARMRYARTALRSLTYNLVGERSLRLHIADDGSPAERREFIAKLMMEATSYWEQPATVTNAERRGVGGSLNLALSCVNGGDDSLWLYTTDDWELTEPLDLKGPISLLENHGYDLVRLGPIHPNLQCVSRFSQTLGWWLDIHQHYGGFAFATRPFIAKKSFYSKVGPFDESLNAYETERLYAERVAKSTCKLAYWGGIDLAGPWCHLANDDISIGSCEV